jgi:hypothetical protein
MLCELSGMSVDKIKGRQFRDRTLRTEQNTQDRKIIR